MKTREEIVDYLLYNFSSVYCGTCSSKDSEQYCDDCHRKSMNWGMHEDIAKIVADWIVKE